MTMGWTDGLLLGADAETTSADPETAHLVTWTCVLDDPGRGDPQTWEWMADPGIEIPTEASNIHGVTTAQARAEGRPERDVVAEILEWLAANWTPVRPIVFYNAAFDLTLLDRRGRALGLLDHEGLPIRGPILDPLIWDRMHPRTRFRKTAHEGGRTLTNVTRFYGCPIDPDKAHNSTVDTLAAVTLARAVGRRHRDLGATSPRELYRWTKRNAMAWSIEITRFIKDKAREEGTPEDEIAAIERNGHWPLIPYTAPSTSAPAAPAAPAPDTATEASDVRPAADSAPARP